MNPPAPVKPFARECLYCGRKCGQHLVCLLCSPLPAADPNLPLFWVAVDKLVDRAAEAGA